MNLTLSNAGAPMVTDLTSAKVKMENVFGNAEIIRKDKGYYILRSEKL